MPGGKNSDGGSEAGGGRSAPHAIASVAMANAGDQSDTGVWEALVILTRAETLSTSGSWCAIRAMSTLISVELAHSASGPTWKDGLPWPMTRKYRRLSASEPKFSPVMVSSRSHRRGEFRRTQYGSSGSTE